MRVNDCWKDRREKARQESILSDPPPQNIFFSWLCAYTIVAFPYGKKTNLALLVFALMIN